MNEEKRDNTDPYETEISNVVSEGEINTYDSPIDPLDIINKDSKINGSQKKNILCGIYKLACTLIVVMTVIFSASELLDFLMSDMGTGNTLFRRIFGSSASNGSGDLFELIIDQSFGKTSIESDNIISQGSSIPPVSSPSEPPFSESIPLDDQTQAPPQISDTDPESSPQPNPTIPENAHPIISMDMSLLSYGEDYIYNNTSLFPNISVLASASLGSIKTSDGPLVLVIHTHGTEAYMPEGATYYTDDGELARSDDPEENMIEIGAEFVRVLEINGIETVHSTVMHDKESYRESYSRSAETIKWYLEKYPSIRYVFDLHRDSIMKSTEELVSAITYIDGDRHAQIMPVVGSGYAGYESNLIFALKLRGLLNGEYEALSRPVCLRESQYNQSLAEVSLLLEIGTSGNTMTEAKRSAALTAEAVAELIKKQIE